MKAMVVTGLNQMEISNVEMPSIDEDGILVKVHTCAICGSDIRIFHSGNSRVSYPAIIGHEIAGEVVETGTKVTKFKAGDRKSVV